jgi:hypothetical protein
MYYSAGSLGCQGTARYSMIGSAQSTGSPALKKRRMAEEPTAIRIFPSKHTLADRPVE